MINQTKPEVIVSSPSRTLAYYETPGPAPRQFFLYRPATARPGAPLVVSVHGIARNAAAHAYRLMAEAEQYGLNVVAPLFEKEIYGQYQQLEDPRTGVRSDLALLDIVDAVGRLTPIAAEKILLFGYSGGAQFAHRFVMAHPNRVASAVLVGAGWYTFPDFAERYPYGLDTEAAGCDLKLSIDAACAVPQHLFVGDLDVERDSSLRQSKRLDRMQGRTRIERGRRWIEAIREYSRGEQTAARITFSTLSGVAHSFVASVERADLPRRIFECFSEDVGLPKLI